MPPEISIQSLFAQLRLEHLLAYLPANGWRGASEVRPELLRFEFDNGESPYVVSLPRSNKSARCRTLVQKAIYTLSCVEDRQPAEIVREVLLAKIEKLAASPERQAVRIRFCNSDSTQPITLQIGARPGENVLMPGEAVEIVAQPSEGNSLEIAIKVPFK